MSSMTWHLGTRVSYLSTLLVFVLVVWGWTSILLRRCKYSPCLGIRCCEFFPPFGASLLYILAFLTWPVSCRGARSARAPSPCPAERTRPDVICGFGARVKLPANCAATCRFGFRKVCRCSAYYVDPELRITCGWLHISRKTLVQCWFNIGPTSVTLAQYWTNTGPGSNFMGQRFIKAMRRLY